MIVMGNEKLIKICESNLKELEQMKPVNVDDLDLSGYDADTRETIIKTYNTMDKTINEQIKYWKSMITDLKGDNGV